ncbi:hypothetical protein [Kitasatospora sp. NBC_01539]|uniref:hypothetical protein n=1 Tax=Kitasatospora sp. NBC_01539 TaxID=2903577 RepID=UPI0038601260
MNDQQPRHPAGQVEAVLDLRGWAPGGGGRDDLLALWNELEPALHGRPLHGGSVHSWDAAHGTIVLEIVRVAPGITTAGPETLFDLVAVRERPRIVHRCADCDALGREGYGCFRCRWCADEGRPERVCVEHAVLLDGALTPSCGRHHPACTDCGAPASFWCGGQNCRSGKAWCEQHRRRHPQDPDTDYCPPCHRLAFPVCEEPGCTASGTVVCDWLDLAGTPCGRQACGRHAHRWQVFGAERVGLGLCRAHSRVKGAPVESLLFQICCGAARRTGVRMPSLAAFSHNLRNCDHRELALDHRAVRAALTGLDGHLRRSGPQRFVRPVERAGADWDKELTRLRGHSDHGEQLVAELRALVREQDARWGEAIAAALRLAEYKPARTGGPGGERPAVLWVHLPPELRGPFIGPQGSRVAAYRQQLGMDVRIEGGNRGGRR